MKRLSLFAVVTGLLLVGSVISSDEKADAKNPLEGVTCPVSGEEIDEAQSLAYKGAKLYFCCDKCPQAFTKNKAKFAAKANHQLVATGQAKAAHCPLTGRDLNPDTAIEIAGVKVSFCCNNCKGKVASAKADEQLTLVFSDKAFAKGFEIPKAKKEKKAGE